MNDQTKGKCCDIGSLSWWATLVVAVLAVPSFGVVAAKMVGIQGLGEIIVFVLACWLCTYLGMRLMSNPKMHDRIIKK
jgi:hypothetical protein